MNQQRIATIGIKDDNTGVYDTLNSIIDQVDSIFLTYYGGSTEYAKKLKDYYGHKLHIRMEHKDNLIGDLGRLNFIGIDLSDEDTVFILDAEYTYSDSYCKEMEKCLQANPVVCLGGIQTGVTNRIISPLTKSVEPNVVVNIPISGLTAFRMGCLREGSIQEEITDKADLQLERLFKLNGVTPIKYWGQHSLFYYNMYFFKNRMSMFNESHPVTIMPDNNNN